MGIGAYRAVGLLEIPSPVGEPWPLWVYTWRGERLHVALSLERTEDWPDLDVWTAGPGTTLCGRSMLLQYPGVFSRLGMPRCMVCCRRLGIPRGAGHPKNDESLRPLFGYPDAAPHP